MRFESAWIGCLCICFSLHTALAEVPTVFASGEASTDRRRGELQTLNGYFPFQPVNTVADWDQRRGEIRRRVLVSQGLWPLPTKTPLNAVVHGRVERDDYVVDRVIFESIPGHYVTGSLYRPKGTAGVKSLPAILSPHGHWKAGRFYDAGEAGAKAQVEQGAETSTVAARFLIQARAVQLARMGCLVFCYDMTGEADSVQISHRPAKWSHLDKKENWGFMSVQADLRLQNMMGLQTWNSIRAVDFLLQLKETDPNRIGVTGASGGGTQSMILGAVDERIAAAMPCVMVSTAMQGGCTCENAPLMRIGQGNVDIAAAIAPRPLGLTAADDWTVELQSKGFPDLVRLYEMLGHRDRLHAVFHTQFRHNYNLVNRLSMYGFFNRHFKLGFDESIAEREFEPLSRQEASVWGGDHPAPSGNQVGDDHEVRILKLATGDSDKRLNALEANSELHEEIVGGGWQTILGRRLSEVGNVKFERRAETDQSIRAGLVMHTDEGEQIPAVVMEPQQTSQTTIIWVTDTGKAELFGSLSEEVSRKLKAGNTVIGADLFGQGESSLEDSSSQRMWYQRGGDQGWHRFSGYTHGYNHCLFAQRVHDILSLIKYAKSKGGDVELIGVGKVAGPLVLAALSQAEGVVANSVVDLEGFRFESVTRHDDPMFVPGAVKYLDVDGLRSLAN
ncbi:MAG: alpha/beta hydrolase family protein [Rubripirellula sp.]